MDCHELGMSHLLGVMAYRPPSAFFRRRYRVVCTCCDFDGDECVELEQAQREFARLRRAEHDLHAQYQPPARRILIMIDEATLAEALHEAGREAVEKRLVVRDDIPVHPFVEWPDLSDKAREGRVLQARWLMDRFDISVRPIPELEMTPGERAVLSAQGEGAPTPTPRTR